MKQIKQLGAYCLVIVGYLATHLASLTLLPVFADESIYIRWSQLIIDDWQRYAFFPLNDGKTPLFFWLLVPFLRLFQDPLLAGRVMSVLIGAAQVSSIGFLIKLLGGKKISIFLGMILTTILPFWFFYHRMVLTDGLLVLLITLTTISVVQLVRAVNQAKSASLVSTLSRRSILIWTVLSGVGFAAALWTKLPAVLAIPGLFALALLPEKQTRAKLISSLFFIAAAVAIGFGGFGLLVLHPAFSQLFSRGSDFLFPWQEVVLSGGWTQTIRNIPSHLEYFGAYLTWPLLVIVVFGLFSKDAKRRKLHHILFWSAVLFALPMMLLGKVVYARYYLPVALFLTAGAALTFEDYINYYLHSSKKMWKQLLVGVGLALLATNTVTYASTFMVYSLVKPDYVPFVSSDREQYLYEWSSGHGIVETTQLIQETAKTQKIAVATEGRFGTLPDGILMYLHNQDVSNIYVEGIGYPVKSIPDEFAQRAQEYDVVWLVINSHRIELAIPDANVLRQYCRPAQAPCLQIWDITEMVKK